MTAMPQRPRPAGLLRVHAWLIVTAVVVTLASATAFALSRTTNYVATAQVSLDPVPTDGTALRPEMASERQIALSGTVTSRAADSLGLAPVDAAQGLSVSVVTESSILNIRYTAATPDAAMAGARAFTESYVDYRNEVAGAQIARVVTTPDRAVPSKVNLPLILGVGLMAGLALGVAVAAVWDRIQARPGEEEVHDAGGVHPLAQRDDRES